MLGQENKGLEKISQTFLKQIIHKFNCKLGYALHIHIDVYNEYIFNFYHGGARKWRFSINKPNLSKTNNLEVKQTKLGHA